jgi:hypothetical protein
VSSLVLPLACAALEGERLGVGGGESSKCQFHDAISDRQIQHIPSPLLRSDRAFRLLAASARCAACCSFCLSRSSFSRLVRAAAPLSFCDPFLAALLASSLAAGSGDSLCLDSVSEECDPVRSLFELPLWLFQVLAAGVSSGRKLSYSSDSSRVRLPREPISLLSSIALLSISSSSYAPLLFMVALLFVLSLILALLVFLRLVSRFEDRGDERLELGSWMGTYREDFGLEKEICQPSLPCSPMLQTEHSQTRLPLIQSRYVLLLVVGVDQGQTHPFEALMILWNSGLHCSQ